MDLYKYPLKFLEDLQDNIKKWNSIDRNNRDKLLTILQNAINFKYSNFENCYSCCASIKYEYYLTSHNNNENPKYTIKEAYNENKEMIELMHHKWVHKKRPIVSKFLLEDYLITDLSNIVMEYLD